MTDSAMIKKLIRIRGISMEEIAEALSISAGLLERKLNNDKEFRFDEIELLCHILRLDDDIDKEQIFFAGNVEKMSTKLAVL